LQTDDTQRLVLGTVEANLGGHDFSVQSVCALFAVAAVTKVGSYGEFLDVGWLNKKASGYRAQSRTQSRRVPQQQGHQPNGLESNFG
jgi:hypothetical protein